MTITMLILENSKVIETLTLDLHGQITCMGEKNGVPSSTDRYISKAIVTC